MEYSIGKPGRIIAVKLDEGEKLYESIESLAERENINCGAVFITGGLRRANVVVGPKQENPIVPDFKNFTGPGEVLGVGTLYRDDEDKPKMHLHCAAGKRDEIIAGCPRGGAEVFLILEITIIEFEGITGVRKMVEEHGVKLLTLQN